MLSIFCKNTEYIVHCKNHSAFWLLFLFLHLGYGQCPSQSTLLSLQGCSPGVCGSSSPRSREEQQQGLGLANWQNCALCKGTTWSALTTKSGTGTMSVMLPTLSLTIRIHTVGSKSDLPFRMVQVFRNNTSAKSQSGLEAIGISFWPLCGTTFIYLFSSLLSCEAL